MADLHFYGLVWINVNFTHRIYADKCVPAPMCDSVTPHLPSVSLNQAAWETKPNSERSERSPEIALRQLLCLTVSDSTSVQAATALRKGYINLGIKKRQGIRIVSAVLGQKNQDPLSFPTFSPRGGGRFWQGWCGNRVSIRL